MMSYWKKIVCFVLVILFAGIGDVYSQDGNNSNGGSGTEQQPTGKAARRKAKKEWKKERRNKIDSEKEKKEYNEKYNTKKTRKRMKKAKKEAKRNNEHKREFFITRWIKNRR